MLSGIVLIVLAAKCRINSIFLVTFRQNIENQAVNFLLNLFTFERINAMHYRSEITVQNLCIYQKRKKLCFEILKIKMYNYDI